MIRLAISVEGQTEEEFVKSVLATHLRPMKIEPIPILLRRASSHGGGGNVSVERLVSEMVHLSWSFDAVTSLVDFYGFRGKGERTVDELEEHLGQEIRRNVPNRKTVIPYVQKHEFEGLLFSDVTAFRAARASNQSIMQLREVRSRFPTPEDINDNLDTAPSKRITQIIPGYKKAVNGPILAMEIGLKTMRAECQRFHEWVKTLESLGRPN